MNKITSTILLAFAILITNNITVHANQELVSSSIKNASVYFIEPENNQTVGGEFKIKFGLDGGMGIAPAGIKIENTGHHHLLIDIGEENLPDFSLPLPANKNLIHFGQGQTETTLSLESGEHTLQLLLGNFIHIPHQPIVISEKITIIVE